LAILALAAAVAALAVADRLAPEPGPPAPAPITGVARAGYAGADQRPGTWFCAGGVGGSGDSRQEVVVVNTTARVLGGTVRLFPAIPLGGQSQQWPATRVEITVGPNARLAVDPVATVVQAAADLANFAEVFVAAEVLMDAPGGVVLQRVVAGDRSDVSPCTTATSPNWHFASMSTRRDARVRLSLLNPFSDDAVVDLAFVTDEGRREPVAYQGLVVPANALVVLDVGSEVTRRDQTSLSAVTRSGNVVAARLQTFNGDLGIAGVVGEVGSPRAADVWLFPLGVTGVDAGATNSFVVYNPGNAEARVDVAAEVDASLRSRGVPPFELAIPPGQRVELRFVGNDGRGGEAHPSSAAYLIDATTRLIASEKYWVSIRSFNGVGVVAERLRTSPAGSTAPGVSAIAGRATAARRGLLVWPTEADAPGSVAIVNPSLETISRVTIEALTAGGRRPLAGLGDIEIRPRQRLLIDLPADASTLALRFDATEPLVASYARPDGLGPVEVILERGTLSDLDTLVF
jgi:hypothetical protein